MGGAAPSGGLVTNAINTAHRSLTLSLFYSLIKYKWWATHVECPLGQISKPLGWFTTAAEPSWQTPPPANSRMSSGCTPMLEKGTPVGCMLGSLNALMSTQMGDYRVECCCKEPFCTTDRLSSFPTTPHGDMHGAAAASWSRGPLSLHRPA